MNKLGEGLRLIYRGSLEHPMNWHLIDAFAKLEEVKTPDTPPAEKENKRDLAEAPNSERSIGSSEPDQKA